MHTTTPHAARDDLLITPRSPYRFLLIPATVIAAVAHIPVTQRI